MTPRLFAGGLFLVECPRWRRGALFVSDMWGQAVYHYTPDGERATVVAFDDVEPGGLGWLPDGTLLVVSMGGRAVLRVDANAAVSTHADLSSVAPFQCNDMVVGRDGTAYISQFGYDFFGGSTDYRPSELIRVTADGTVDTVAGDMAVPNGMAITPDHASLIVAEPGASRLTQFAINADGTLTDRTVYATIAPVAGQPVAPPDGICTDGDGVVWMAEPLGRRVLRVEPGGAITHEIPFDGHALAVALDDAEATLYVCVTDHIHRSHRNGPPSARIMAVAL